ncbi:hypothetical protein V8F06_006397 [Rhypophila decipiens]
MDRRGSSRLFLFSLTSSSVFFVFFPFHFSTFVSKSSFNNTAFIFSSLLSLWITLLNCLCIPLTQFVFFSLESSVSF